MAEPETLHGYTLPQLAKLYRDTAEELRAQCTETTKVQLALLKATERADRLKVDRLALLAALATVLDPGCGEADREKARQLVAEMEADGAP